MFLSAIFVRSSDPTGLLLWCVVGFAVGIGLFVYGFRLLLRRRLILDTPFSKIRSASMGMVEVSGQAVGPYTMMAPVTGRPCYYHRTLVWEWKQSGKNKQWVKVAAECMHVPFFVDDNTGRLLIDPRGADLDLHRDFEQEFCDSFFTTKDPVPGNVRSFLARQGIVTNNKIKVEEYCIKPKNSLFILGTLAENPGIDISPQPVRDAEPVTSLSRQGFSFSFNTFSFSSRGSRNDFDFEISSPAPVLATRSDARMVQVIRLSQQSDSGNTAELTQQQKIAAALMKAGISNPAAWSAAGLTEPGLTTPGTQVMTDPSAIVTAPGTTGAASNADPATRANTFDSHPAVVLMKGTNNKTFLISWRSQQEVARSLGWKCALMIWGGPVLVLVSLYFFLGIKNLL